MKNYSYIVNHVSSVKESISVYPHNNIVCPLSALLKYNIPYILSAASL